MNDPRFQTFMTSVEIDGDRQHCYLKDHVDKYLETIQPKPVVGQVIGEASNEEAMEKAWQKRALFKRLSTPELFVLGWKDCSTHQSQTKPIDTEAWKAVERLTSALIYIKGIVERGTGRTLGPDTVIENAVLDYVKELEAMHPKPVEVSNEHGEFVKKLYEVRNEPDKLNAVVMREHALLIDRQGVR